MIALVVLVVSVAALDSLNPSTVAPALVLAIGSRPQRDLSAFTAGVAAISTLGGLVLLVGPGRELLARLSRPSADTRELVELATGLLLTVSGVAVWILRARLRQRLDSDTRLGGRSSLSVGAAIMAVELPTAVPYFAAILATVETTRSLLAQVSLVLVYNLVFVAPLLALLAAITVRRELAGVIAVALRRVSKKYGPALIAGVASCVGMALAVDAAVRLKSG